MDQPVRGLIAEVFTPLSPNGPEGSPALDSAGLRALIHRVAGQADALLLAGPLAGQGTLLSREIWGQVMEAGLSAAPRELPLVLNVTAGEGEDSLERAAWLRERLGPRPAFLLDLPLYHRSNRGLPGWLEELARAGGKPVIFMNRPDLVRGRRGAMKHKNLLPQVVGKCAAEGKLAGVVEAGEFRQGLAMERVLRGMTPERALYDGDELAFLARPSRWGIVSFGAGLMPGRWRFLVDQSLNRGQRLDNPGRRRLIEAGRQARELAGLTATYPASILACLFHGMGLTATARTLAPEAEEPLVEAARSWAASELS